MQPARDPARMLTEVVEGDPSAAAELLALVYDKLLLLAGRFMKGQSPEHTLQSTALVHEAYLKLVDQAGTDWKDRTHFFAVAARAMRQVLVDHARAKLAEKRGGGRRRLLFVQLAAPSEGGEVDFLQLDEALKKLAELNDRMSQVVELRFFAGMTITETATILGISDSTVEKDWRFAKVWLRDHLAEEATP